LRPAVRLKLLTFHYSPTVGVIDETPLAEFTRNKALISIRDRFFLAKDIAHVLHIVTWQVPKNPAHLLAQVPPERTTRPYPPAKYLPAPLLLSPFFWKISHHPAEIPKGSLRPLEKPGETVVKW
jgi:hypothetical protein